MAILSFFGLMIVHLLRVNLSVAILAMVTPTATVLQTETCPQDITSTSAKAGQSKGEFNWSEADQGIILGSFFYGYVFSNFLGGPLAERIGGKIVFGFSILITALLTLLTPVAARTSKYALISLRVLEGFFEGMALPSLHTICSRWLPRQELGIVYSVLHTGAGIGTVIGFPLTGALTQSSSLGGWPSVFYICGSSGVVWFGFWWFLMYETPAKHPRISEHEKEYIMSNIDTPSHGKATAPWTRILTSAPVWAVAITSFCTHWVSQSVFVDLPTFMNYILHFNIRTNGALNSLSHIINIIVQWFGGILISSILAKKILPVNTARKVFNIISCLIVSGAFLGAIFSGCNSGLVLFCIMLGMGALGLTVPTVAVSLFDIAPQYAGTTMGLTHGFSNIASCIAPYVIGILTNDNQTLSQWHKVFYISIAMSIIASLVFTLFGSSVLQPWAAPSSTSELPVTEKEEIKTEIKTVPITLIYQTSL